jgi:hypothetical protein
MQAKEHMDIYPKNSARDAKRAHMYAPAPPVGAADMGRLQAPVPRAARGTDKNRLDMGLYEELERRLPREIDMSDELERRHGRETPPPSMFFHEVLLSGPDDEQRKRAVDRSAPSSFETAVTNMGYQDGYYGGYQDDDDDDDDEDGYEYLERPIAGAHSGTHDSRADELFVMDKMEDIYHTYLASGGNQTGAGVTIMLRDIPYRMQVEPDLFRILRQTADLNHVDYIYLPMTIEGVSTRSNVQPRNKGYCFIHFSVEATAHAFATRVQEYVIPDTFGGKTMFASRAKFQGLSMNLVNLLDVQSKKWRPKHGVAHIRDSTGELVCVGLLPLRNLFKKRSVRSGWQGAKAAGQLRALPAGRRVSP